MPQRRVRTDELQLLIADLQAFEQQAVFAPIVQLISESIGLLQVYRLDPSNERAVSFQATAHRRALGKLPSPDEVGERFLFDVAVIQTFVEEWSNDRLAIPMPVYPKYGAGWNYRRVYPGQLDHDRNPGVDVFGFRGRPALDCVDLLDYPWLVHELGHSLFRANETGFEERFHSDLREKVAKSSARTIPLTGTAQQRAGEHRRELSSYWHPSSEQDNRAHEIAVDLVAVWTVGPAFLATYLDFVRTDNLDPFQLDAHHPSYAVRTEALEEAARRLNWTDLADELTVALAKWKTNRKSFNAGNEYARLADSDLVLKVVHHAFQSFEAIGLPRCMSDNVESAEAHYQDIDSIEFGSELLLCADVAHRRLPQDKFNDWHSGVVSNLAQRVTL